MSIAPVHTGTRDIMVASAPAERQKLGIHIFVARQSSDDSSKGSVGSSTNLSNSTPPTTLSGSPSSCDHGKTITAITPYVAAQSATNTPEVQDHALHFAQKLAAIIISPLFGVWLLTSMLDDVCVFFGVAAILYVCFAAHPQEHHDVPSTAKEAASLPPVIQHASTAFADMQRPDSTGLYSIVDGRLAELKVVKWLKLIPAIETNKQLLTLCGISHIDIVPEGYCTAAADEREQQLEATEWSGEPKQEQDESLCYIGAIRNLFSHEQHDGLLEFAEAVQYLFDVVSEDESIDDTEPNYVMKYHATHLTMGQKSEYPKTLDDLYKQHENPIFNDGSFGPAWGQKWNRNRFGDDISFVGSGDPKVLGTEATIGRAVQDDMQDIIFVHSKIRRHSPNLKHTAGWTYKTRISKTFNNPFLTALNLIYLEKVLEIGPVKTQQDVKNYRWEQTRNRRAPCPPGFRPRDAPDFAKFAEYLTEAQDANVNYGSVDYPHTWPPCNYLGDTITAARAAVNYQKLEDFNPVLPWLENIDERLLYNPHNYNSCECCRSAIDALQAYRKEEVSDERIDKDNHTPGHNYHEEFRSRPLHGSVLEDRERLKAAGEENFPAAFALRTQMVKQCKCHEIITNHLYVLLDSEAKEDLNQQIANPGGLLPAPGMMHVSVYPADVRVWPLTMSFSIDQLPPRCSHGIKHRSPVNPEWCKKCCRSGAICRCVDCKAHARLMGYQEVLVKPANARGWLGDIK